MKNQYQVFLMIGFFDNSGNGFEKNDPENPYICILNQHSICFSSKVIGLK